MSDIAITLSEPGSLNGFPGFSFESIRVDTPGVVTFECPDNPTEADMEQLRRRDVAEMFEIKDGKISPRFVPIRDRISNPIGRTDYGWGEEMKRKHLSAAYARSWPQFPYNSRAHDGVAHLVGGGPSLRRCLPQLRRMARQKKNFVLSLNKSHDFLWNLPKMGLGSAIPSWGAALLDPCDWVKDYITPRPGVNYFIGDQCAPATFDVFEKPDIKKWIWRATNPRKDTDIVPSSMHFILGGSTVGLRMRTMLYLCGFREIHYWGFDSSAEVTPEHPEGRLHGYDKVDSVRERLTVKVLDENNFEQEFITNSHMARQAQEYIEHRQFWIEGVKAGNIQWVQDTFHGDGLLPTIAARLGLHADQKRNVKLNMSEFIPGSPAITPDSQNQGVTDNAA